MLCMVTLPGLEEYFGRWDEPLPARTSTPSVDGIRSGCVPPHGT